MGKFNKIFQQTNKLQMIYVSFNLLDKIVHLLILILDLL
jgi:hypothetical protein